MTKNQIEIPIQLVLDDMSKQVAEQSKTIAMLRAQISVITAENQQLRAQLSDHNGGVDDAGNAKSVA